MYCLNGMRIIRRTVRRNGQIVEQTVSEVPTLATLLSRYQTQSSECSPFIAGFSTSEARLAARSMANDFGCSAADIEGTMGLPRNDEQPRDVRTSFSADLSRARGAMARLREAIEARGISVPRIADAVVRGLMATPFRSARPYPSTRSYAELMAIAEEAMRRSTAPEPAPTQVNAWCEENGYTEPFYQEGRWWGFPPNGVMPVEIKRENNSGDRNSYNLSVDGIRWNHHQREPNHNHLAESLVDWHGERE